MRLIFILIGVNLSFCSACQKSSDELRKDIYALLAGVDGEFAVACKDLQTGESLFINERESFHAASTMKTPVLIELYKQSSSGKFAMQDSLPIHNEFVSIVDSSLFSCNPDDDSEKNLYLLIGQNRALYDLAYDMIISSSNLATNILIDHLDARKVTESMRMLGADKIQILRGVEDIKAYRMGLSNTTTARDLLVIFEKLALGQVVSPDASDAMINILLDQRFNDIIPALLPEEVRVAHKTGSITGVHHDTGIVFLPDGRKYVLILLSKNLQDFDIGTQALAKVSKLVYDWME